MKHHNQEISSLWDGYLTLLTDRAFLVLWDWGIRIPPHLLISENTKAMTTKLKGHVEGPKTFPLRSATSADDFI